jgi:hypothetical protein
MTKLLSGLHFNKLYSGIRFLKLTNINEIHNRMGFITGLNRDHIDFNPIGECSAGGIYFCELIKVPMWIQYGQTFCVYYREVTIPDDAQVYIETNKFKADKMILSDRQEIWNNNDMCRLIVSAIGVYLYYVKNQTEEICKIALMQDGLALQYVPDKVPELCKIAVMQNGLALQYVEIQTYELCKIAVKQNGLALRYVHDPIEEICKMAIEQDEKAFDYVKNQTVELSKLLIEKNPFLFDDLIDQTSELSTIITKNTNLILIYSKEKVKSLFSMSAILNDGLKLYVKDVKV